MKKKILWCPQHQITEEQEKELGQEWPGFKIATLEKEYGKLFNMLQNCPIERVKLKRLALELKKTTEKFGLVVLPIGSPAFMWEFAQRITCSYKLSSDSDSDSDIRVYGPQFLFSHSRRVLKDILQKDGTVIKISIFKHVKFFGFF